jgi:TAG lipase/steryl ester hydrolase/phospholipase A2/LPA acyltransferase
VCAADTSEPPRLLNYLTAPNVLIWSAVACSSAFPFLFAPQDLLARDTRGRVVRCAGAAAGPAPAPADS